jgi:drug/metabolite transporter (DMT)-like permease
MRSLSPLRSLDVRGTLTALLLAALWGGNPVATKLGLADAPPLRLAAMRFALGGLTVLAYVWLTRRRAVFTLRRGEWRPICALGFLLAIQVGLMNVGLDRTTAAHGTVLVNSYAIHTVVLAHFFMPGDRLTAAKLGGVIVAYGGIVLLFAGSLSLDSGTLLGDLIVMVSALLLGERTVYLARAVQRLDPMKLLLGQSAIGSTCLLLASLWLEADTATRYTLSLGASLFYQGLVVAGFNFVVNAWLHQIYRPSALAICSLTSPIFGVLLAAVVAGDHLTPPLLASSVMVALGVGLATLDRGRRREPAAATGDKLGA